MFDEDVGGEAGKVVGSLRFQREQQADQANRCTGQLQAPAGMTLMGRPTSKPWASVIPGCRNESQPAS